MTTSPPTSHRGRTWASTPPACPRLFPTRPPKFITTPSARPMKVVDLVTHTSGLTYGFMNRTNVDRPTARLRGRVQRRGRPRYDDRAVSDLPLEFSPGTGWNYSVSIDVMGYLVQKLSGMSFGEFLRTRLFEPLGMTDTAFWCPPEKTRPLRVLLPTERGRRPQAAGRCGKEHLCLATKPGIRRRRPGIDRA